ncbi:MAG: iron-containing alcohol dehydrogenase [Spirochaetales bacterium]
MNEAANEAIARTLDAFADRLDTEVVRLGEGTVESAGELFRTVLPEGTWLVACDEQTREVAGERVLASLGRAGAAVYPLDLGEHPVCDDASIRRCMDALRQAGAVAGVAVGSGTITDIVKMAAYRTGIPMAVVATAPSMNGYTSAISAVLSDGVKTTVPCRPPKAVLADTDVLAAAPIRMIQSGLGDLLSKPVSNADWAISAYLGLSEHSQDAARIIEEGSTLLTGVAAKLPKRDPEAIGNLSATLVLSGFAMSVAGGSSPASGGEHLISHYLDMTAIAEGIPHDFHGCQVGVGTLASALLYEHLFSIKKEQIDVSLLSSRLPEWSDYASRLSRRYGRLYDAVAIHAKAGYPDRDTLASRLTLLKENWDEILLKAGTLLRSAESIETELASAGCPTRFSHIGVDPQRAYRAIAHSKDIRSRYTVLDLAWELGLLEEQAERIAARLAGD